MSIGLLNLPTEILQKVFNQVPNELKSTCRTFIVMYNNYYFNLFIKRFGIKTIKEIENNEKLIKSLKRYIKSFDYWRGTIRKIICNHYRLEDINGIESEFIRDSWKLIYGIFMNRRIFLEYEDYQFNYNYNNNNQNLNINKSIKLTTGLYNLSCGIIIKNFNSMSSTKITIINETNNNEIIHEFQPATNFSELVPHNKFVLMDMGDFEIRKRIFEIDEGEDGEEIYDPMVNIRVIVTENGEMLKSAFIICYLDINAYQLKDIIIDKGNGKMRCKFDKYWIAWWIDNQIPNPDNVVDKLLKNVYKNVDKGEDGGEDEVDEDEDIDVGFSEKFYSCVNEDGEKLRREWKFRNQIDRRKFEENISDDDDDDKVLLNEPIKWKMSTILEI